MELKKLENKLEQKTDVKAETSTSEKSPECESKTSTNDLSSELLSIAIDDIPIPTDNNSLETSATLKLDDIILPNSDTSVSLEKQYSTSLSSSPVPPASSTTTTNSQSPTVILTPPVTKKSELKSSIWLKKALNSTEHKVNKSKKINKLPMPPGINQIDLEVIESPPSGPPSPIPLPKAKTPPRKSIMNLPMPPGK